MRRRRWWCPGTRCSRCAIRASCSAISTASSSRPSRRKPISYTDAKSGQVVYAYHAKLDRSAAPTPLISTARCTTAPSRSSAPSAPSPRGRAPFTFTSFGDQGTPTLGKKFVPPAGVTLPSPPFVNDNLGSPAAGDTTLGVERLQPLFHLFNGDLCYANLADDRVRTWWDFWENNSRSARNRPWMPSAGNHENELGNGPIGYQAYQTYFSLPEARRPDRCDARALVRLHRRLGARDQHRQRRHLPTRTAATPTCAAIRPARRRRGWKRNWPRPAAIAISTGSWCACTRSRSRPSTSSTAPTSGSARNGCRCSTSTASISWCAGTSTTTSARTRSAAGKPNATLTPIPAATATDVIDTTKGTVHMVIGGGGTSVPSNQLFFNPPACRVITAVGEPDPATGKRPPVYVQGGRALVGGAQRRPRLRLRGLHRRSGLTARRHHHDQGHLLRRGRDRTASSRRSKPFTLRRPRRD